MDEKMSLTDEEIKVLIKSQKWPDCFDIEAAYRHAADAATGRTFLFQGQRGETPPDDYGEQTKRDAISRSTYRPTRDSNYFGLAVAPYQAGAGEGRQLA